MRSLGVLKVVIATSALSLIAVLLSPATAAPAAQLVTCVDLVSGKERIPRTGTCRPTQEATAKWRLAQSDSAVASTSTSKSLTVCSNKESSPVTYQRIRTSCYKHMQTSLYTRSSILPAKPVITQVSSYNYESASLSLATDPAANLDAPIAYYTIASSKGDVKRVSSWRDLNVNVSGLNSSTTYTFTITATSADGTSPVSAASLPVTTQVYVAPTPAATAAAAPVYTVGQMGPGGGRVFYVASTPFTCGPTLNLNCTYLEAAPTSGTNAWTDATYAWSGVTTPAIVTSSSAIGSGYKNTLAMITQSNTALRAGTISQAYRGPNNLTDWYLPSKDELNQMCKWQRGVAWVSDSTVCSGGASNSGPGAAGFVAVGFGISYWSSTQDAGSAFSAWYQWFDLGNQGDGGGKVNAFNVRPIRAF